MNTLALVWKNISRQKSAALLSILLTTFGVAILAVLYISNDVLEKQLENNSKNIDLVVGAKGSPMQLILSSIYHVDNPTGNIPISEANQIADNPLVKMAVPISLGDNFKGHRIIGTAPSFLDLYNVKLQEGKIWKQSFQAVVGSDVAQKQQLKIGDKIHGAHGLSADAHVHEDHPYTVVGILERANNIVDNLILCNLESVWDVHGIAHDHEHIHNENCEHDHHEGDAHNHGQNHSHDHHHGEAAHSHEHDEHSDHHHGEENHSHKHSEDLHSHSHDQHETTTNDKHQHKDEEVLLDEKPQSNDFIKSIGEDMLEKQGVEITALLIAYNSPSAMAVIPRLVNQSTNMQAASPAIESSRIFSLLGVGIDTAVILAYIIMLIAALSIFISLYNALKERKYDLAIMRTLGASKTKLFGLVIVEAIVITFVGSLIGLLMAHIVLYYINTQTSQSADIFEALTCYPQEVWIVLIAIALGILAALIPAIKAFNTSISKTLANK